jgi:HK97 family phage major capsid protein
VTLKLARTGRERDPFAPQTAGEAFADALRDGARGVEVRTLIGSGSATTDAGEFTGPALPDSPASRRRPLYVQDLIPHTPTSNNRVPYIRRLTPLTVDQGATMTAEGAAKTETEVKYEGADAYMRKVTAWVPASTEVLDDAEALATTVDEDLAAQLEFREQDQLLNGDGTAPNLPGLIGLTGVLTVKATGGTATSLVGDYAGNLALGLQVVEHDEVRATAIVMNSDDFWAMVTRRAGGGSTGDDHYDLDPFEDATDWTAWRVPILRTQSLPAGTAVVGDFTRGAKIRDREETTVRLGDQHDTFLTAGKVAVVAEKRLGVEWKIPDAFAVVTFR